MTSPQYTRELTTVKIRKTPLVVTGIFVELLKQYFQLNEGQFRWSQDCNSSQIVVAPSYEWNPTEFAAQKRPACYIKRGGLTYTRVAINDLHSIHPAEDTKGFAVVGSGDVSLLCISTESGAVELLAEEVSGFLTAYSPEIRKELTFSTFRVAGIQPIGVLKEYTNAFVVPVNIVIGFNEVWSLTYKAPKIAHIVTSLAVHEQLDSQGVAYGEGLYGEGTY